MGDMNGMTNVMVPVPEDFVQHVAELPADDGVGGERQVDDERPERCGSALLMGPHDDVGTVVKEEPMMYIKHTRQTDTPARPRNKQIFITSQIMGVNMNRPGRNGK